MGGCRCTYRNCTVKSDGKTHLFHYPVFDKVRCHQWLINAGRYEFLNLRVSQVKNRCVCQHHFADEWFMNDLKDKLKIEAIPTLDGPFCDSSKFIGQGVPKEPFAPPPIIYEDIENDEYISDRKANYNVKYADFLTNCEETNLMIKMEDNDSKQNLELQMAAQKTNNSTNKEVLQKVSINRNNAIESHKDTTNTNTMFTHEVIIEPFPHSQIVSDETATVKPIDQSTPIQRKKNKVRIISQKKITEPEKKIIVPVQGASFETVSPSMVLKVIKHVPKNQPNIEPSASKLESVTNLSEMTNMIDPKPFEVPCLDLSGTTNTAALSTPAKPQSVEVINDKPPPLTAKPVVSSNKLSADRVAAINAKRQFNMRLKDIIEAGIDKIAMKTPPRKVSLVKKTSKQSSLAKDTSESDDIISYLESRLFRMENLLLNKIEQNKKKIIELKKTFDTRNECTDTTGEPELSISTISSKSKGEAHKKQLYKEIQQYLTPDTNSMVYEELFINKFKPNANPEQEQHTKRRRVW